MTMNPPKRHLNPIPNLANRDTVKTSSTIYLYVKNGKHFFFEKYLPLLLDAKADMPQVSDYQQRVACRENCLQCGSE